jgi:hypothetical protein
MTFAFFGNADLDAAVSGGLDPVGAGHADPSIFLMSVNLYQVP